ncbi:MAG: hypothetical protein ACREBQ_13665, partial [Nitrososphaerales archaeon]
VIRHVGQKTEQQHSTDNDQARGHGTRHMPPFQRGHDWVNEDSEEGGEQQSDTKGTGKKTESQEEHENYDPQQPCYAPE